MSSNDIYFAKSEFYKTQLQERLSEHAFPIYNHVFYLLNFERFNSLNFIDKETIFIEMKDIAKDYMKPDPKKKNIILRIKDQPNFIVVQPKVTPGLEPNEHLLELERTDFSAKDIEKLIVPKYF